MTWVMNFTSTINNNSQTIVRLGLHSLLTFNVSEVVTGEMYAMMIRRVVVKCRRFCRGSIITGNGGRKWRRRCVDAPATFSRSQGKDDHGQGPTHFY